MTPYLLARLKSGQVFQNVEQRLHAAGSIVELDQLRHLSADEVDLLIWQERCARKSTGFSYGYRQAFAGTVGS